jgi:hypothetical protein
LQDLLQGFFFADLRKHAEHETITATTASTYEIDDTTGFSVGSLVFASGFTDAANNGLKTVTTVTADTSIAVAETLIAETPPADARLAVAGFEFDAGDAEVDVTGTLPKITTTTKDLTELGLVPGEWVFVGGDVAVTQFANAANNGRKRVRSVSANEIVFDKSDQAMVADTGAGQTIQIFTGRVLKNESDPTLIKKRSYHLERTLGAADPALPAQTQSEYLTGCVASEFTLNWSTADKMTADLAFIAIDHETRDGATGVKAGTRQTFDPGDAFNTSSDIPRIKLAVHSDSSAAADPLFAYVTEMTLSINNNLSVNKAVGRLGGFNVTAGIFSVTGSLTAYFADVAAVQAVRSNSDVTVDAHIVKKNAGISLDIPLLALGDGRLSVELDSPITIPLTLDAGRGFEVVEAMNHVLLMTFFDYLPNAAA